MELFMNSSAILFMSSLFPNPAEDKIVAPWNLYKETLLYVYTFSVS